MWWSGSLGANRGLTFDALQVAEAAVTALEISTSGGVLGVGTSEGEAIAVATPGLSTMQRVRNAHMVFVTAAAVAPDGTALLTVCRSETLAAVTRGRHLRFGCRPHTRLRFVDPWLCEMMLEHFEVCCDSQSKDGLPDAA